jgi:hypothetical protein
MGRNKKIINNLNETTEIKIDNNFDADINKIDESYMFADIITINDFKKKEKMLYEVLQSFFSQCELDEIKMIINIINGNHQISLRFLDWFVTRYCYLYKLTIPINNLYNKEKISNVNISYKAQLKSFKKRYFDPFRRKKKFNYCFINYDLNILTTLGQLNFFRWVISFDIIKYVVENYEFINEKIDHVNSYFKKNIIELNFLTTDDSTDNNKSNFSIELFEQNKNDCKIEVGKDINSDINLIFENKIKSINLIKNKSNKIITNIKDSQSQYKYPQVTRNICIEF